MKRFLLSTAHFLVFAAACGDQYDDAKAASDEHAEPTLDETIKLANEKQDAKKAAAGAEAKVEKPMFQTKPIKKDASSAPIEKSCRGFDLEGAKYSPGGDVLPNKCEPFHPTTNNPYAVRCIDGGLGTKPSFQAISTASCRLRPTRAFSTAFTRKAKRILSVCRPVTWAATTTSRPSGPWTLVRRRRPTSKLARPILRTRTSTVRTRACGPAHTI
jgi:hypothetical protein